MRHDFVCFFENHHLLDDAVYILCMIVCNAHELFIIG